MPQEGAEWRLNQLQQDISAKTMEHTIARVQLREEMNKVKTRLETQMKLRSMREQKEGEPPPSKPDDTFTRTATWKIEGISDKIRTIPRNQPIRSDSFTILGVSDIQLEFFPNGRESTSLEGFCSLFLWCPAGTKIKYQLRVGNHWAAPDEDEYTAPMGHGHSNFCNLQAHINSADDSLEVGIRVLDITHQDTMSVRGLNLIATAPEGLVKHESMVLSHIDVSTVEWRIKRVKQLLEVTPKGSSIYSPTFSLAGVRQMLLEFYPAGVDVQPKENWCALYLRCPPETSLYVTFLAGTSEPADAGAPSPAAGAAAGPLDVLSFKPKIKKGPVAAKFTGNAAKGIPNFCDLKELLGKGDEIIVGVQVRNKKIEEELERTELRM